MATQSTTNIPTGVAPWLEIVREKVESLSYGVVQVVVHDHRVTQIERTDRVRLESSSGHRSATQPRESL